MKNFSILALMLVLSTTAFSQKTETAYDKEADFSKLHSYFLIGGKVLRYDNIPSQNKAVGKFIDSALVSNLNNKEYKKANSIDNADFVVTYTAGVKAVEDLSQLEGMPAQQFGYGEAYAANNAWYNESSKSWWVKRKQAGTLIIDIYDKATKKLIWRSYSEADLENQNLYKLAEKAIKKSTRRIPKK